MDVTWLIAAQIFVVWFLALLFQLGDLFTAWLDGRRALIATHNRPALRERVGGLFWVVPLLAVVFVMVAASGAYAARVLIDENRPLVSLVVVIVASAVVAGSWVVVVFAATRTDRPGYARLISTLVSLEGDKVSPGRVEQLRAELAEIDSREPRSQAAARWWRFVPVILAVTLLMSVWVSVGRSDGAILAWLIVVAVVLFVVSWALAAITIRVAAASGAAWEIVYRERRDVASRLLADVERRSAKRVAGLGDRVSRALQILREQQG